MVSSLLSAPSPVLKQSYYTYGFIAAPGLSSKDHRTDPKKDQDDLKQQTVDGLVGVLSSVA